MSRERPAVISALILGLTSLETQAAAKYWDGNKLYKECSEMSAFCAAYLQGVADVVAKESGMATPNATVCLPAKTSVRQLRDAVVDLLEKVPDMRSEPAAFLATGAMKQAWPCPK